MWESTICHTTYTHAHTETHTQHFPALMSELPDDDGVMGCGWSNRTSGQVAPHKDPFIVVCPLCCWSCAPPSQQVSHFDFFFFDCCFFLLRSTGIQWHLFDPPSPVWYVWCLFPLLRTWRCRSNSWSGSPRFGVFVPADNNCHLLMIHVASYRPPLFCSE